QYKVDICSRRPLSQCQLCRGHGLSLLALARGMPALPAKGGFSRPSSLPLTVGSQVSWDCTIVRPTEDLLLFPLESPPSVPINDAAPRIKKKQKHIYYDWINNVREYAIGLDELE